MNIEEILQDMIRNDDEQDKEASEWMSEGGSEWGGRRGTHRPLAWQTARDSSLAWTTPSGPIVSLK